MLLRSRSRRIALLLGLAALFITAQARAAETGNGSKNFSVPTSVPNYFSNESGPLQGPVSETQRGALYMNQTYGTPGATAVARGPEHVAMAEPRGRYAHGRVSYDRRGRPISARRVATRERPIYHAVAHGHPVYHAVVAHGHPVYHAVVAHGRPVYHAVAHASSHGHIEHVAARSHTARPVVHRPAQVTSAHRHGRG